MNAISGAPNPSTVGQTVTFTATFNGTPANCTATIRDNTNSVTLCTTGSTAGTNSATCSASFATPGARTVGNSGVGGTSGCTANGAPTYVQTVNAAVVSVPTVGEWTMWGLAGLIALGGGVVLARRSRRLV